MKFRMLLLLSALLLVALPIQAQDVDVDITVARDVSLAFTTPIQPGELFPDTLTVVYATLEVEGLEPGDEIDIVWYFEGDELDSIGFENEEDSDEFTMWTNWADPDGLEAGDWEIEVEYDGDVVASVDFEITDDEYVFPIRFAEDCGRGTGQLINEDTEFEDVEFLYVYLEYANFNEELVSIIWTIDGDEFDLDIEFEFDDEDWVCIFITNGGDPLPEGEYGLILLDEDGDEFFESDDDNNAELEN